MAHTLAWSQRRWIRATENVVGRGAAVVAGFMMMVVGLGLGVTMIMLPVGVVIGLMGVALVVSGLFADVGPAALSTTPALSLKRP